MLYFSAAKRFIISLFSIAMLSACCSSQLPALKFTPEDIKPTGVKINAELKSITVSVVRDNQKPDQIKLAFRGNNYEEFFKLSLKDALEKSAEKSAVFNDFSNNKLSLVATVMKYETAKSGSHFDTDLIIHYQLLNRLTGELMFAKAIESTGAVYGSSFKAAARFTQAKNMAVQANVQQFISSLSEFKGFKSATEKNHKHKKHKGKVKKKKEA